MTALDRYLNAIHATPASGYTPMDVAILRNAARLEVEQLTAAITRREAEVRAEALEEAAKVCDAEVATITARGMFYNHDTLLPSTLARSIRALSASPAPAAQTTDDKEGTP